MGKLEITFEYDELIAALTRLALALENKQAPVQVIAEVPVEVLAPLKEKALPVTTKPPEQSHPSTKEEKPVTIEQVRAVLTAKSKAGKKVSFEDLFKKYDADKLSTVDPARYAELLKEAREL